MDTENDHFYDQSNLSSASSSNNSSSSNLLINLPMLPILHAHDDFDDDDDDDGQQPPQQQQHQSQLQSQMPADAMASSGGGAVSANNIATSTFNNDTNNTHTDANPSVIAQINAPFLFNNHISPPLSSPSTASSSSSPPPPSMQMDSLSQSSSTPQSSSSPQEQQQQHDQSSMHNPQQHNITQPIATTQTQNNPTNTLFANETTEHLHQEHSPTPTFHQQHDSLQSTEHDDNHDDEDDGATQDQQAPPPHSLSTPAAGIVLDTAAIADTIDVSAIEAPPLNSNPDGLVRIEDDDDDIELDEEQVPEQDDYDDEVFASSSQQLQRQNPLVLAASGASSSAGVTHSPPTSLPLLQAVPKHPNYASAGGYSTSQQHHQLLSSQASPQLPPSSLNSIFNFDRNGQSTMYGQGDGPHSSSSGGHPLPHQVPIIDRLKLLYPNVNELETPLPRCWSPHDKCLSIGLSQNNLRVHYKGAGKQHNDAASVRTAYPIPPACGLYYFEVKIISKGKNGYMGIGLTAQQFRMNRLPGWDKQSYGYHGDDGNSFSSSGNGQTYGPTFTTGDVIGCCVDFVKNTCFYTKNGTHLGIAFRDLPSKLYPTVGLQTPGEEVDANFGQEPFKFDRIEDMMRQMREEMRATIYDFPLCEHGDPTTLLHKMVSSYLVHNGYSQTAESFAKSTGQNFDEDISSIRNRQKIIKLAMSGKMGQAIEQTLRSYPGLLENNKNLWFMLKCRQFIEMINGSDVEQYCAGFDGKSSNSTTTHTQITPPNQTSVIQSTKSYQNGSKHGTGNSTFVINNENQSEQQELKPTTALVDSGAGDCNSDNSGNSVSNNNKSNDVESNSSIDYQNDVEMENNGHANGNSCKNGNANNFNSSLDIDEEMDVETPISTRKYSDVIERILDFGKELSLMGQQLEKDNKLTDEERQMLEDAFSLIAYSNPWSSPLGWQLCPTRRETVCTALNSAILESLSYPRRPPLDVCVAHAAELLKVMAQASLGACAFVNIEDVFPQN